MNFKEGDLVQVTFAGGTMEAEIFLASSNGLSLVLLLDGSLDFYPPLLPILWLDGAYIDLFWAQPVFIARKDAG
jgi:hypothetical protein